MNNPLSRKKIVIVGGGAAGFFGAIEAARLNPEAEVTILEKSNQVLGKVKVSGGGRCNVTHACFDNQQLIHFYPRGKDFLLPVFEQFSTKDCIHWFKERGVELKTESDNRMFPVSDSSQTIIDCFIDAIEQAGIQLKLQCGVEDFFRSGDRWTITTNQGEFQTDSILFAVGSTPALWKLFQTKGVNCISPVPSLFTFNCKDPRIEGLMGLSVPLAKVELKNMPFKSEGPLLITHWGMSGPAILKLSAFAARELAACNYKFSIEVNWINQHQKEVLSQLKILRDSEAKKLIGSQAYFDVPKRLWKSICDHLQINDLKWASAGNKHLELLAKELCAGSFDINGKSTFKDEFVTAGGIDLEEVDAKRMECKSLPGLFFAGEFLNIDAVTGGFNFQAAWSTAFVAAQHL